jgi:thiosulfate dehydrogenase [quinone] large subunit
MQTGANTQRRGNFIASVSDLELAYFFFRFTMGVDIFFHGAMRLYTGLGAWVTFQEAAFVPPKSPLPMWAVHDFLTVLPFVEVLLGALLLLGLFTRFALLAGGAMIFALVFGNLTRQDWGTVGNNLHYILYYTGMIAAYRYNCFALDHWLAKPRDAGRVAAAPAE